MQVGQERGATCRCRRQRRLPRRTARACQASAALAKKAAGADVSSRGAGKVPGTAACRERHRLGKPDWDPAAFKEGGGCVWVAAGGAWPCRHD